MDESCKSCSFYKNLNDILNCTQDVLYKFNIKTKSYEFISPAVESSIGMTLEQVKTMGINSITDNLHPDDLKEFNRIYHQLLDNGVDEDCISIQYRVKNIKSEKYIWRSDHINIIRDKDGKIEYILGTSRDITQTKQLEEHLHQLKDNYKNLYDNAEIALFRSTIEDGQLLECNQKLVEILGYDSKQDCIDNFIVSKRYVNPALREKMKKILLEKGSFKDFEAEVYKKDGTICSFRYSAKLYREKGYLEGAAYEITNFNKLTPTENKILEMILNGKSNRQIARQLDRSIRTIEDHRAHIMEKMSVKNLVQLTKKAIEAGIY